MAKIAVAPLVGAWIEILLSEQRREQPASLPSWERGLKFLNAFVLQSSIYVAPLVGAWIEMLLRIKPDHLPVRRSPRGSVD